VDFSDMYARARMVPPKLASNVVRFPPLPKDYIVAQESLSAARKISC
jgi:hypothetical protein